MVGALHRVPVRDGGRRVLLALLLCALAAVPAGAQVSDVHRLVSRPDGTRFSDTTGILTVDAQAKAVRFEARDRPGFSVAFDRVTALHYEVSKFPFRVFRRSGHYLVLHHRLESGASASEILRLPGEAVDEVLASLEGATGLRVDRSEAAGSFLGLPIHAGPGAPVRVTDASGQILEGRVVSVSSTSIDLGAAGRVDAGAVGRVDVHDSILDGVVSGAVIALVPAALFSADRALRGNGGPSFAGVWVMVAGGFLGGAIDAQVLRRAYRPSVGANAAPRVRFEIGATARSVRLTLRF